MAHAGHADTAASSEYAMRFAEQAFKTAARLHGVLTADRTRPFDEA